MPQTKKISTGNQLSRLRQRRCVGRAAGAHLSRGLGTLRIAVASRILVLLTDAKTTEACREKGERVGSRLIAVEAIVSASRLTLVFGTSECRLSCGMAKG